MLEDYLDEILKVYNYVDSIVITDKRGYIEYYKVFNMNNEGLHIKNVIGRHILEIHPTLNENTSTIIRVIKNGKPIYNEQQYVRLLNGEQVCAIATTLPIKKNNEIVGVVDIFNYMDSEHKIKEFEIMLKDSIKAKDNGKLYNLDDIITKDDTLLEIKQRIRTISSTKSSVLIYGKTGTGKELIAQSIHTCSNRKEKPFISQNCAAIPSTLLESILFGTVKGTYTGAEDRNGLFELANGGTLFLDEINSMDIGIQAKILTAIETKQVRRLGGQKSINTDVRIIAAVNEDPHELIQKGRLREDLFYRLGVVQINLPPLKCRKNDILVLSKYFIEHYNISMNKDIKGLSSEVEKVFMEYNWPGNVRELKNLIEGAFNLCKGDEIELMHLPEYILRRKQISPEIKLGTQSLTNMVEDYEKEIIKKAMEETSHPSEIARMLKITRQSLKYKMDKYGL